MNLIKVKSPKKFYMEDYMQDFKDEMNNLMKDTFHDFGLTQLEPDKKFTYWKPPVELSEQNGNYILKAEIPGVNKEDIEVEVGDDFVGIKTEFKEQHEEKSENVYRSEFKYGKFARNIPLPSEIDNTQAKAEYKDGILTITAPKCKEEQQRIKKIKPE